MPKLKIDLKTDFEKPLPEFDIRGIVGNDLPCNDIRIVSIDKLVPHKDNFYPLDDIELLAEDIRREGLKHNLVVSPNADGTFTIISGHRRFAAVKLLREQGLFDDDMLPCSFITAKSEDELMQDLIMLNATSREISDSVKMKQYRLLKPILERQKDNGELTGRIREHMAKIMNMSVGQISKIENIEHNADDSVKREIEKENLTISTANEIAKLSKEEQREMVLSNPVEEIATRDVKKKTAKNKKCDTGVTFGNSTTDDCDTSVTIKSISEEENNCDTSVTIKNISEEENNCDTSVTIMIDRPALLKYVTEACSILSYDEAGIHALVSTLETVLNRSNVN